MFRHLFKNFTVNVARFLKSIWRFCIIGQTDIKHFDKYQISNIKTLFGPMIKELFGAIIKELFGIMIKDQPFGTKIKEPFWNHD